MNSTHLAPRPSRRGFLVRLLFAAGLLLGGSPAAFVWAAAPIHQRLIWTDDPATTATLSWNTTEPGETHRVHYREADAKEESAESAYANGAYLDGDGSLYYHHAKLEGLKPDTKYVVRLESDGDASRPFYFRTAPQGDQSFKLFFGGDSRSGLEERRQMNQMMAQLMTERPDILALVHGGDYVASGGSFGQWKQWMADHELTTAKDGRLLPIVPARGNHDRGELFNQVFAFPEGDDNYYAFSFGSMLRLVTLNSEISMAGDQAEWLEAELAAARPAHTWLVAQYHRPAYPAVKTPGGTLQHFVPLFEKYNLDLACEADGHSIKRTVPIRDNQLDPTGVVYIGEGGLGVGQRTPRKDRWFLRPPGKAGKGHHVQLLGFTPDELEYQALLLGGEVFDQHTIEAREK